jgi:hypothetical protein
LTISFKRTVGRRRPHILNTLSNFIPPRLLDIQTQMSFCSRRLRFPYSVRLLQYYSPFFVSDYRTFDGLQDGLLTNILSFL